MKKAPHKSPYHVDPDKFYQDLCDWQDSGVAKIPDCIGVALIKIANGKCRKREWIGYTWFEELLQEAILKGVESCHKFDRTKTTNPAGAFSHWCYQAVITKSTSEQLHSTIPKIVYLNDFCFEDMHDTNTIDNDERLQQLEFLNDLTVQTEKFYESRRRKKRNSKEVIEFADTKDTDFF